MRRLPPHFPLRRRWGFRLAAVLLSLAPLFLLEGLLTLGGWGTPDPSLDPFVGFSSVVPLFERNAENTRLEISPRRRRFFAMDSFPIVKSPGAFRIFVLGESTVQGNPYSIETAFPTWLRLALKTADPQRNWEVVNCGGISYASYRLVPIFQECLNYQPDLFIVCCGHNEFLEDRTYRHVLRLPKLLEEPADWLLQRRVVTVARTLADQLGVKSQRPTLNTDTDPMLDYHNGLAAFHRDESRAEGIVAHYESNMRRMVQLARRGGVPLIMVRPLSNLSDCPPFKSEPDHTLVKADQERVDALCSGAKALYGSDLQGAVQLLEEAAQIDRLNPVIQYELGQCLETLGEFARAREAFIRARDLDVCPLRMTTPLEVALDEVIADEEIPFLNAHALLERRTQPGILGGYWLVDHVHPSFEGHQLIATALVEQMHSLGMVNPARGWRKLSRESFANHFASLNRSYFHQGNRKLQLLMEWAKGNADGPPAEARFPELISKADRFFPISSPREGEAPAESR